MGKLSEQQIQDIIHKASVLQKFSKGVSGEDYQKRENLTELFALADEMDLDRKYVAEAYHEMMGIPVHDPVIVDNNDFGSTEVLGFAIGRLDPELVSELKARIEYHFNTVGKVSHRRNKKVWKAKPSGPSRLIASSTSPEVELKEEGPGIRIKVKQSLKTLNKFYLPGILGAFTGFMMIAGVIFGQAANDEAPLLIIGSLFIIASIFYARFINGRKEKKKKGLAELTEVLQQSIERRSKAETEAEAEAGPLPNMLKEKTSEIEFPETETAASEPAPKPQKKKTRS